LNKNIITFSQLLKQCIKQCKGKVFYTKKRVLNGFYVDCFFLKSYWKVPQSKWIHSDKYFITNFISAEYIQPSWLTAIPHARVWFWHARLWFSHSCVWFSHVLCWTTLLQYKHKPKLQAHSGGCFKKQHCTQACTINTHCAACRIDTQITPKQVRLSVSFLFFLSIYNSNEIVDFFIEFLDELGFFIKERFWTKKNVCRSAVLLLFGLGFVKLWVLFGFKAPGAISVEFRVVPMQICLKSRILHS
jgi:hypothetical protein